MRKFFAYFFASMSFLFFVIWIVSPGPGTLNAAYNFGFNLVFLLSVLLPGFFSFILFRKK